MITQDLQALFDQVLAELLAIRTDITILKYDIEQIQSQISELENQPIDTDHGQTLHRL